MTRDPKTDPQPGDVLERGWIERRVTEATAQVVGWVCPQLPGEAGSCSRSTWGRWAKDATVVHRDVKPANSPAAVRELAKALEHQRPIADPASPLSDRDARALSAIEEGAGPDGWARQGQRVLTRLAGLSHGAFCRAVGDLRPAGLAELREQPGHRTPDWLRITEAGVAALEAHREAHPDFSTETPRGLVGRTVGHSGPQRGPQNGPLSSEDDDACLSPMSLSGQDKENKDTPSSAEGGEPRGPHGGPLNGPLNGLRSVPDRILIEAIRTQRALLAVMEAALSGRAPETLNNEHGDGPCEECAAPTVRRRNERDEPFLGCSRYPECRRTRGIGGQSSAPPKRPAKDTWSPAERAALERARRASNPGPVTVASLVSVAPLAVLPGGSGGGGLRHG